MKSFSSILITLLFIFQSMHCAAWEGDSWNFYYQLQRATFWDIKRADFDIWVVDPDDSNLNNTEINSIQRDWKILLAYLSVWEAEDYRSYWKDSWLDDSPSFIYKMNPNWDWNYKVNYWDEKWKDIVFKQIDNIIELWYDWAYLNVIDSYEYFKNKWNPKARREMTKFVKRISAYAKKKSKWFLIIPQNALELTHSKSYLDAIDWVWKESTWYINDKKSDEDGMKIELKYMKKVRLLWKIVLAVDYPKRNKKQCDFVLQASKHGFLTNVWTRKLDRQTRVNCKQPPFR